MPRNCHPQNQHLAGLAMGPCSGDDLRMPAREQLIRLLQDAHAGELAAYHAYDGPARSVRDPQEKIEIEKIRDEDGTTNFIFAAKR